MVTRTGEREIGRAVKSMFMQILVMWAQHVRARQHEIRLQLYQSYRLSILHKNQS